PPTQTPNKISSKQRQRHLLRIRFDKSTPTIFKTRLGHHVFVYIVHCNTFSSPRFGRNAKGGCDGEGDAAEYERSFVHA
ncbi:hypothetical protein HDV00_003247, partial [Rhizophlyctis rosea]